jgi:hypothetical protein
VFSIVVGRTSVLVIISAFIIAQFTTLMDGTLVVAIEYPIVIK